MLANDGEALQGGYPHGSILHAQCARQFADDIRLKFGERGDIWVKRRIALDLRAEGKVNHLPEWHLDRQAAWP